MTAATLDQSIGVRSSFIPARALLFSAGAILAAAGWYGPSPWPLLLTLGFPLLLGFARSREEARWASFFYFGASWFPAILSACAFFPQALLASAILLWLIPTGLVSLLFSLPIGYRHRPFLFLAALLVQGFSFVGLGSPFSVAGLLYPGKPFLGLAFTALLILSLLTRRIVLFAPLVAVAAIANIRYAPPPPIPGWEACNTALGRGDPIADWGRMQAALFTASQSGAKVMVFPESLISDWTPGASERFFRPAIDTLAAQGKTVLFGAEVPIGDREWENRLIAVGAEPAHYRQRVPIPVAMWGHGYAATPLGPSAIRVAGKRVAVLLCYEQLLPLTEVLSLRERPDALLAPSNLYWAPAAVAIAQSNTVHAWARLAGVPILQAVNR